MRHLIALALVLALTGLTGTYAAEHPTSKGGCPDKAGESATQKNMGHDATTQAEMAAKMKQMDQRLDDLVAKMNAAEGDARIDAVIAVVNELVRQRRAMKQMMHSMMKGCMKSEGTSSMKMMEHPGSTTSSAEEATESEADKE